MLGITIYNHNIVIVIVFYFLRRPETGKVCLTNLVGESTILQKKKLKQLISKQSEHIEKLKLKCLPESIAQKQLTIKFLKSILNCQQKYLE